MSHPIIGECSDVPVLSTSPLIELNSKSEEIPSPAFVIRRDLNFLGAYREPYPIPNSKSLLSVKIPSSLVILFLFLSNKLIFHF